VIGRGVLAATLAASCLALAPSVASAASTLTFSQGILTIKATAGSYTVGCTAANQVAINGAATSPAVGCDRVEIFVFIVGAGTTVANTVDMRGVTLTAFPFIQPTGGVGGIYERGVLFSAVSPVTYLGTPWGDKIDAPGPSVLDGLKGDDIMFVSTGNAAVMRGGADNDRLAASGGVNHTIDGGSGNDTITAREFGGGVIRGLAGDDVIDVATSSPVTVDSGDGNDTISIFSISAVSVEGGLGSDRIKDYQSTQNLVGGLTTVKPELVAGVQKLRVINAARTYLAGGIELFTSRAPRQVDGQPLYDITMLQSTVVEVVLDADPSAPPTSVITVLHVPGGVWTRSDAERKVRAPGLANFRWTIVPNGNRNIDLSIVAA
jgi:Ca2+-binding RTX toxin-like protein